MDNRKTIVVTDVIPLFNCFIKEHSLHAIGTWNMKAIRQPRPCIRCTSIQDFFKQESSFNADLIDGYAGYGRVLA